MARRPSAPRSMSLEERLAFHSEPYAPGRCQLWLGAKTNGYGALRFQGRMVIVPRAVWEFERGPIPKGLCVLHRCDNPPCRNIDHLFLGTRADNAADKVAKGRQSRSPSPGEQNGGAKLTEADVLDIRAMPPDVPRWVVAAMYGVGRTSINNICWRQTWAHLK